MTAQVKPTDDPNKYCVGEGRACLLPNRVNDRPVAVARALPGVIVLVHGVNDVGVSYAAQETGLCQGLNERLSRTDLHAAGYRLPLTERDEKLEADPDAVYYSRDGKGYSPVIPFYWGYREVEESVNRNTPHGQYLDRHDNRLDKSSAQGGGPFANATSNLPDMWRSGFHGYGGFFNWVNSDPIHPLRGGPDRRYMLLAAMRLAALVQAIRHYHPDETVTLIGHSQGCLLSLLAQSFLDEWHERLADCLILNNPPYSLAEPFAEKAQTGGLQQSTRARLATLQNLVRAVTEKPHTEPPLSALVDGQRFGVCGPFWQATEAQRYTPSGASHQTFAERDNRGKVYLYFCPEDLTVGLDNVIGIGTFGVPDQVMGRGESGWMRELSALPSLGNRFFQRVFTERERQGSSLAVGAPPATYCLHEAGEDFHAYIPPGHSTRFNHTPAVGETRRITGEALVPPCVPNLRYGEIAGGTLAVDPIVAAMAITNDGIGSRREIVADPQGEQSDRSFQTILNSGELPRIEAQLNAGKEKEDSCRVESAYWVGPGKIHIVRSETPNEARLRWQSTQSMENSYHSAIVANPEHSRHVHAFDVAIAQGESVSNPTFRALLTKLADWRVVVKKDEGGKTKTLLKDIQTSPLYADLPPKVRTLTEANARYYSEGTLPLEEIPAAPPKTVVSETVERAGQPPLQFANPHHA